MYRVAIVDDHAVVRGGLRALLNEAGGIDVVAEARSVPDAIDMLRGNAALDVLILDISLPDQSGLELLRRIHVQYPDIRVLVLSGYPEEHYALAALKAGAFGYLNKASSELVVDAVRQIARGQKYISPAVAQLLATHMGSDARAQAHELLSERELDVFLRLAKGETVGNISATLFLSVKTVSTYRTRILDKLNLKTNSDLTYYALKNGLVD
jgi:two-component system, NarL family, invasion response regulator UvrY